MPGLRASGLSLPLFIAVGSADHLGIADQAETLAAAWRAEGMPAELVLVPSGHEPAVWRGLLRHALAYVFRQTAPPGR